MHRHIQHGDQISKLGVELLFQIPGNIPSRSTSVSRWFHVHTEGGCIFIYNIPQMCTRRTTHTRLSNTGSLEIYLAVYLMVSVKLGSCAALMACLVRSARISRRSRTAVAGSRLGVSRPSLHPTHPHANTGVMALMCIE